MFALDCAGCGTRLLAHSYVGQPRRWFASQEALALEATRAGWADGTCPTCQQQTHRHDQ